MGSTLDLSNNDITSLDLLACRSLSTVILFDNPIRTLTLKVQPDTIVQCDMDEFEFTDVGDNILMKKGDLEVHLNKNRQDKQLWPKMPYFSAYEEAVTLKLIEIMIGISKSMYDCVDFTPKDAVTFLNTLSQNNNI